MHRSLLTFCAILLSYMPLHAGENNVVVLGTNHVPPFKIVEGQALSGINAEVLKEIFRDTGLELSVRSCPWKRCLLDLERGIIDVFIGVFKSPEREKVFYFCEPPYKDRSDKAFYLLKGKGDRVQKYEDLYPLKIGVTRGYKNFERFDNDEKLQKAFVTEHIQNITKLIKGRIDVFVQTEVAADYFIKLNGYADKIEKAPYKFGDIHPSYFVVSRKSRYMDRVEDFEKNLRRFVIEQKYNQIKKKWTQQNWEK